MCAWLPGMHDIYACDVQEPTLANHALPALPAKTAANHLSTTDIASVLMAPRSSHRVVYLANLFAKDHPSQKLSHQSQCRIQFCNFLGICS